MYVLRFLPFLLVVGVLQATRPEWWTPDALPCPSVVVMFTFFVTLCLGWLMLNKLTFKGLSYIFVGGLLPDIVFTLMSHSIYGSWGFELNPWVGSIGSVWPLVPITAVFWLSLYLVRESGVGKGLLQFYALMRCAAILSHPMTWCYL